MNPQQILPLVQTLALPLYWLIGRELLGLGPAVGILFMLLAPFATHTAVLGIGFIVSYLNQHEQPGLRHSRRRDWLVAYLREAGVSIRQFYWLMPFRAGFRAPEPAAPLRAPPIILVHGYGCNRGLWLPAARWFGRRGYRVSAINLLPLHCSIDDYARAIAAEVARVKAATGAGHVALVCHSMGGLAGRAYLRYCARQQVDPSLALLITLGTPHRGTHIARIGLGENARQMRFGGNWVEQLGRDELQTAAGVGTVSACPRITTVCSLQDNIVSRPFEQRLCLPATRAVVVRQLGHMSLATSVRVFRLIERLLRRCASQPAGAGSPVD
jgi:pimeloyl-ACP methyl ester carboxylesterase